ncbi:hypothetical protein GGX14DRAFT_184270 [Mycena pura]|uniref:Uncharacterized protein n=1 Tax=Mycena pura TaxID=153505 RepID=A0AAD6V2K4_9AGAR|nr:hypothetical protein GGX14DRAFT_184270 [Mycena pura]
MSTTPSLASQQPPPIPSMPTESQQKMLTDILIHLCVIPGPVRDAPPPTKRRRKNAAPVNPTADCYRDAARFFPRGIHLFKNITSVLDDGAAACWSDEPPTSPTPELQATFDTHKKLFQALVTHLGNLAPVLRHLYAYYPNAWTLYVQEFNHIAHQARQSDTNEFKYRFDYLLPSPGRDVLDPPLGTTDAKTDRGWAHPWTKRLLMPIKDRLSLPAHPFKSTGLSPPDLRTDKQKRRGDK